MGAPGAELFDQVVGRQPEQPRHRRRDAGQRRAVAGAAGRDAARGVALQREPLAQAQACRVGTQWRRGRIRQVERGEVLGDLAQIGIAERCQQLGHRRVRAPAVAKRLQLVEQVAGRLAGDARVVAVARGAALLAVAAGASEHALRHRVLDARRGGRGGRSGRGSRSRRLGERAAGMAAQREDEPGDGAGGVVRRAAPACRAAAPAHAQAHAQASGAGKPTGSATACAPASARSPARTPARSAADRFWLVFHLPVRVCTRSSMPTIARSIVVT